MRKRRQRRIVVEGGGRRRRGGEEEGGGGGGEGNLVNGTNTSTSVNSVPQNLIFSVITRTARKIKELPLGGINIGGNPFI